MAYRESIGEAFSKPLKEIESAGRQSSLGREESERADMMPQMLKLKQQMMQAQLGLLKQKGASLGRAQNMQEQLLNLKRQALAERAREFDKKFGAMSSNGSIPNIMQKFRYGVPFKSQLADGNQGTFSMPTGAARSQMEKVLDAWPQVVPAMQQINQGAKYYMNAPDKFKKYLSTMAAYMANPDSVPASAQKIITDAGVSLSAITQAAETASRVMNIPKTNEGMAQAFHLFQPQKGETPQSFATRQQQLFKNLHERYLQNSYQVQNGIPLDAEAQKDMKNFVDSHANDDTFGNLDNSEQAAGMQNTQGGKSSNSDYLSDENIQQAMNAKGMTHAQAVDFLKALHSKGLV